MLAADQETLARGFAWKAPHAEKWEGSAGPSGPASRSSMARCLGRLRLRDLHPGGDHEIAAGDVFDLGGAGGDPLIFYAGAYRPLGTGP